MTTPPPPAQPYQPTYAGAPKRPGTVLAAFIIVLVEMILLIVIGFIGLFTVFAGGAMLASVFDSYGFSGSMAGAVIGIVAALLIALIIVWGLQIFFAAKMNGGANWARITLTVFQAIGAIFLLLGLFSPQDVSGVIVGLVMLALSVLIIVLMFVPASNAYFSARRHA